jgi:hypothetical protein
VPVSTVDPDRTSDTVIEAYLVELRHRAAIRTA